METNLEFKMFDVDNDSNKKNIKRKFLIGIILLTIVTVSTYIYYSGDETKN
jgi:hypothetical protein